MSNIEARQANCEANNDVFLQKTLGLPENAQQILRIEGKTGLNTFRNVSYFSLPNGNGFRVIEENAADTEYAERFRVEEISVNDLDEIVDITETYNKKSIGTLMLLRSYLSSQLSRSFQ